jgi:hypothetical protein
VFYNVLAGGGAGRFTIGWFGRWGWISACLLFGYFFGIIFSTANSIGSHKRFAGAADGK